MSKQINGANLVYIICLSKHLVKEMHWNQQFYCQLIPCPVRNATEVASLLSPCYLSELLLIFLLVTL